MRLLRYRDGLSVRIGRLEGNHVESLAPGFPSSMRTLIEQVSGGLAVSTDTGKEPLPLDSVSLVAPIDDPGKVVAIGLNYRDHASEAALVVPDEPLVFAKFPSAIVGPGEPIRWDPALTSGVDYEAELGVIIGKPARRVTSAQALDYVFGYTCLNDVSARDIQNRDGQWVRAKSLDTFCPLGPWIVTAEEIPDPQALSITCTVSGETMQAASTADMFFSVAELISRLSYAFTLHPGDVIATGTPPGVGWFREPRRVLRDGDDVAVSIEGIGTLANPVAAVDTGLGANVAVPDGR